jgi:hypothetical protein
MADLLNELDRVALTSDLPEENLSAGDEGTIMMVFREGAGSYTGPDGYTVEFKSEGEGRFPSYQLVNLSPDQVHPADTPAKVSA